MDEKLVLSILLAKEAEILKLQSEKAENEATIRKLTQEKKELEKKLVDRGEKSEAKENQKSQQSTTAPMAPLAAATVLANSAQATLMATNPSEANINTLIMDLIGRIDRLEEEHRELQGKMEQNSGRNDALWIQNEEMKRIERETEDGLSCIRNDFSGRLKEVSDKQQGVSDAITALQEGIAEISHKIGRIEGKQSEDHLTIQARPVPLEEKRQLIPGQVDKGTILVLGGEKYIGGTDDMVILKQDKWIKLALKLPKELRGGGAVYLDGEIYIFGGIWMEKELYKLDNKTLEWIRLEDMNEGRKFINNNSVEWNGSIWVFGGWNGSSYLKSVERYDTKENKWINMPDMKYSRDSAAAAVHNGKFIVCGGRGDGSNYLKSVECFDPESGVWTEMNDMPTPLACHSLVSYGNNLILMGGHDGNTYFNTVLEVSNLEGKGTWKELPPMKQPRHYFSAAVLDNEIFVIGGSNGIGKSLDKTEIFNGNSWREGPQLPNRCCNMSSVVIPRPLADILSN